MSASVICFGEVLWDVLPDGKKIGGAPLNVALRLNALGIPTIIASKVGNDSLGKRLLDFVSNQNLNTAFIQIDRFHETGQVLVHLDENGSANYDIAHPSAWDKIEALPALKEQVALCDAFLFGSLVARDAISKQTLIELLPKANFKVFDVNLRAPHYTFSLLEKFMQTADLIKFNDEELHEISKSLGCTSVTLEEHIKFIATHTNTQKICVTTGSDGALLYLNGTLIQQRGFPVEVNDTVGAGDSFLATLLEGLLTQRIPQEALKRACAMGALVARSSGANPKISEEKLNRFIEEHSS